MCNAIKDCYVIAIANQKGCYVPVAHVQHRPERERRRVSKTTTTLNLGIGLVNQGKRVLLVDADAQGSFTASLGYGEPDSMEVTFPTILTKLAQDEEVAKDEGLLTHEEGISLMPYR